MLKEILNSKYISRRLFVGVVYGVALTLKDWTEFQTICFTVIALAVIVSLTIRGTDEVKEAKEEEKKIGFTA